MVFGGFLCGKGVKVSGCEQVGFSGTKSLGVDAGENHVNGERKLSGFVSTKIQNIPYERILHNSIGSPDEFKDYFFNTYKVFNFLIIVLLCHSTGFFLLQRKTIC